MNASSAVVPLHRRLRRPLFSTALRALVGLTGAAFASIHADAADTRAGTPLDSFVAPTDTGGIDAAKWLPDGGAIYVSGNTTYRLHADGSQDTGYTSHSFNNRVKSILLRDDGSVLVAGLWTVMDGNVSSNRHYLVHLAADGTLDETFPTNGFASTGILSLAPGAGGKFYVASTGDYSAGSLLRFNADGTRDSTFNAAIERGTPWVARELADGRVLVGHHTVDNSGIFTGGYIHRLTATGAIDPTFTGASIDYGSATALDLLPDGRIVIAGFFASVDGDTDHASIAILSADGALDPSFNTHTARFLGDSSSTTTAPPALRVQDDKILLGWGFNKIGETDVGGLVRLNLDGSLDNTFAFGADLKFSGGRVWGIDLTPAGDIFVTGGFSGYTGSTPSTATIWRAILLAGSATDSDPDTLAAPVLGETTGITQTALTIHWAASAGASGYRAELATDADFTTGLLSQTLDDVSTSATFSGLSAATTYHLRVTALGADEITATSEPATATTANTPPPPAGKPVAQKITFTAPAKVTYSDVPITLSATASSGLPVGFELVSGPAALDEDGVTLRLTGAGKVVVKAAQPGDGTYKPAPAVTRTITVAKAVLAVNFADVSRLVGKANPAAFAIDGYTGFVGADTEDDITTAPTGVTKATAASPAGVYPITPKGGSSANYAFAPGDGSVAVEGFGGSYEALLVDDDELPLGKLEITVSANSLAFTGTLHLASEPAAITLRSNLEATDGASARGTFRRTTNGLAALDLGFEIVGDTLDGDLSRNGEAYLSIGTGTRLFVQTVENKKKLPAAWTGAHTLVLLAPTAATDDAPRLLPQGAGSASAAIAATGIMTVKGTLADGAKLTATAKADPTGLYRVFARPYAKRTDSVLSGPLALVAHPDQTRFQGRFHVPADQGLLYWSKAPSPAKPLDKSYRQGFAADVTAALDPWLPPAAKAATFNGVTIAPGNLAQRLGLAATANVDAHLLLAFPGDPDLGARESFLPATLLLNAKGAVSVPPPLPVKADNPAFTLKVTPATGAFTGSFTLSDTPEATPPAKPKTITRKVTFTGTLRQTPDGDTVLGAGSCLLPDFDKNAQQPSYELILSPSAP